MEDEIKKTERRGLVAQPLRIGIMINSLSSTRWVSKVVADIQSSSFARLVLVVQNAATLAPKKKPLGDRLKTFWTHGLFNRYRSWDRERHRAEIDALEEVDLSEVLKDITTLSVEPLQKGFVDRFAADDIERIRKANLDVLFRFGFRILRGEILSSAKYGVWSFHHGDNREYRGAPPGFWEIYENNPVTGSILQLLTESLDGGRVIYRSLSATNFDSLYASLNPMYWKTAEFALRRLRDLYRHGWEYLEALEEFNESVNYKKAIYRTPAAPIMVRFLVKLATRKLFRRCSSLIFAERSQWFTAYRARNASRTVADDRRNFRVVLPPRNRFYADPFLIKRNGKNYLFIEDYDFSKSRAVISCMELGKDGRLGSPGTVLERDYHLSYPFLFETQGQVYMIPETRETKRIELYRAAEFPREWVFVKVLIENVLAVDSTIFSYQGKLWLFCNIAVPGGSTFDELHLFHADFLEGEWRPHPKNPIVSDVRRSRPAGALFFEGGILIRPSQDCSLRYGYAMMFNEVEVLSEYDYRERPRMRIEPDWYPGSICTHTYNRTEDFEVLDGMMIKRHLRLMSPLSSRTANS